jgi:hypothetical protein
VFGFAVVVLSRDIFMRFREPFRALPSVVGIVKVLSVELTR